MNSKIRKAVFPVAGLGTRFLPATKANPKEMLTVVDKPLIQYAAEEAVNAGIKELSFEDSAEPIICRRPANVSRSFVASISRNAFRFLTAVSSFNSSSCGPSTAACNCESGNA